MPPSFTLRLDGLLAEHQRRVLEIWAEIERRAPDVAAWLREEPAWRGPRPLCDAGVAGLMEEARRLLGV